MKRNTSRILALVLALCMVLSLAACGDGTPTVTEVALDVTTVTLGPSDTQRLTATVTYSDGTTDSTVEWTSSDDAVATVTRGVITAKGAGTATITATAGDKTATCTVTVESIAVELDQTTLDMERGTEVQLTATVKKGDTAVDEQVEWTTSDERIATVDATGKVTATGEGTATITAQRAGANQKATCTVTVTWTKPEGYAPVDYYEQNKVPTDTWGYWNDPANYVGGTSEMFEAYTQTSENSEAGKATFTFAVNSRSDADLDYSIIQITYRSAALQGGQLETNHNYSVTLDLESNVAGTIRLNFFGEETTNQFDIVEGKNTITAEFRHGDWGTIFPDGVYDNVESAIFLLLGNLGEPGQTVTVSIDNVHWTDLGEAAEKTEEPNFNQPATDPAEIPVLDAESVALTLDAANAVAGEGQSGGEQYEITTEDGGMSYTVGYSGVYGATYSHIVIPLPEGVDTAACNVFAVTVTNNGTIPMTIRFDVNGTTAGGTNNTTDIVTSSVATVGVPNTDLAWGGTSLTVDAGATTTLYLNYDPNTERGVPANLNVAFDSVWEASPAEHSGNVTISGFTFDYVEPPKAPEAPDVAPVDLGLVSTDIYTVEKDETALTYTVTYTDVDADSYATLAADLSTAGAAEGNTFAATIKNNGTETATVRFDIQGTTPVGDNGVTDCAVSSVSIGGSTNTDLTWGGTTVTVPAGEEVTVIITYENAGDHGTPVSLIVFIDSSIYGDEGTHSGNLVFSNFKFANVE